MHAPDPRHHGRREGQDCTKNRRGNDQPARPPSAHIDTEGVHNIPVDLKRERHWVVWRWVWRQDKNKGQGGWDKPPINPHTGKPTDATDESAWLSFDEARALAIKLGDGIGYALGKDGPYTGVDLDKVLDTQGRLDPRAEDVVRRLGSFTYITPSGAGLRIIVRGRLPRDAKGKPQCRTAKHPGIEFYDCDRYFTLTGDRWAGTPATIEDRQEELTALHAEVFAARPKPKASARPPANLDDDALLTKAKDAKNGAKFAALFRGDISAYNGDESAADQALCNLLAFWTRGDAEAIDRLFRRSGLYREDKWGARPDYRNRTIQKALEREEFYDPHHRPSPNGDGQRGDERPAIEINTRRDLVVAETIKILPADPDLYRQGDVLVVVKRYAEDVATLHGGVELRNARDAVSVGMVGEAGLSCHLTALADFFSWKKDKAGEYVSVAAHPPTWLMKAILEQPVPGIRPLIGVVEVPFFRPDGSLIEQPGYDPATGYFYAPSVDIGTLPDRPTQADAEKAACTLFEAVDQFPFAEGAVAVWLSGLLTVLARPMIDGPVPGHVFNANRARVGKGKLIDAIGVIATGRRVPTTSYSESNEEAIKTKVALALAATPIIHLDNLESGRSYGSGPLDSALTSMEVNERILGASKMTKRLILRLVWLLSGNNVSPGKDAHGRWLQCNLITDLEHPEERTDLVHADLLAYIREHRTELVRAALVILKAHIVAGRPTGGWGPLGSFEAWDPIVRGAVWYATGQDVNASRRKAADEAPEHLAQLALIDAWEELPGGGADGNGLTSEAVYQIATVEAQSHPHFVHALMRFSRDGKVPTLRVIGQIVGSLKGKNLGGKMFVKSGEHRHSALWKVCPV